MKSKTLKFLTALSVLSVATPAYSNILFDVYAGGSFGVGGYTLYTDGNDFSKSVQSYGAVLGLDIPMFRVELEYNYLNADDANLNLGFVNAYFKLPMPIVKPYIGAGVGTTFDSKFEPANLKLDDVMAYHGMLGLTLDLPVVPFNIDVEGRVLYAPEIYTNIDLLQYEGRVKLRYVF
jgi:hypothetical protein